IPSWAMPLRLAAGRRAASPTRACPRALSKTASTGALAEGGAVLLNVYRYTKFSELKARKIWARSGLSSEPYIALLSDPTSHCIIVN
ncbi:MAG: hypothetical protein Q8P07_05655, partial [bacterium]|nr:hypothetical protein [bacterium]